MAKTAVGIKADILEGARTYARSTMDVSAGQKGAILGNLNRALGGNSNRKVVLSWLFRGSPTAEMSSKNLSAAQWLALKFWIGSWCDENGIWRTRPEFIVEALIVLKHVLKSIVAAKGNRIEPLPGGMVDTAIKEFGGSVTQKA